MNIFILAFFIDQKDVLQDNFHPLLFNFEHLFLFV